MLSLPLLVRGKVKSGLMRGINFGFGVLVVAVLLLMMMMMMMMLAWTHCFLACRIILSRSWFVLVWWWWCCWHERIAYLWQEISMKEWIIRMRCVHVCVCVTVQSAMFFYLVGSTRQLSARTPLCLTNSMIPFPEPIKFCMLAACFCSVHDLTLFCM